jgi:protein Tob/BTG
MDPTIREAGLSCGLNQQALEKVLPKELTMWVDPKEVSYRLGENGSIGIVFDGTVRINSFYSDLTSPAALNKSLQQRCKGQVFITRDNFQQMPTLVQG